MAQSYHQKLYPQLYTADGVLKSSLTPKVDYKGTGTGIDPLNLAGPDGKGTGFDLADGGINPLFTEVVKEQPELSEFYDDQILREVRKSAPKKKTKEKPNAPGGTGKESTADEEKDAKGMLQKFFDKYDLVSLGNAIGRGDGLLNEIERQDKEIAALSTAAEEKQYQRGREGLADALSISKAEVDKLYKEGMINTTLTSRASFYADRKAPRGTPEHSGFILEWMKENAPKATAAAMGLQSPKDIMDQRLLQFMSQDPQFKTIMENYEAGGYGGTLPDAGASTDIDATAGIK